MICSVPRCRRASSRASPAGRCGPRSRRRRRRRAPVSPSRRWRRASRSSIRSWRSSSQSSARVELVLVDALDAELRGQRRLPERAHRRELRARARSPAGQIIARHRSRSRRGLRDRAAAPARAGAPSPAPPARARPGASARSRTPRRRRRALAAQRRPHRLDRLRRQVREVGERLVLDLAALPVGAPQQRRRVLALTHTDAWS